MRSLFKQQGDVLMVSSPIPKEAETFDAKKTLAYGEATGHAHRISYGEVEFLKHQSKTYLRVIKEAEIVHEEHKPIVLQPGDYRYDIVKEFDYDEMESRRVAD